MPESAVVAQMRSFKAQLARAEQEQLAQMARRWLAVERRLDGQMTALAYEMSAVHEAGGTVSAATLATSVRYRELLIQMEGELERYSAYADRTISSGQRTLTRAGIDHAETAITAQGVTTSFNRLPVMAVEHMVGLAGNGSPLSTLLRQTWPLAAQGMTQELVNGVALGYNPRKTARNMAQGATASLDRMMTIARSEQLRVYKEVNRQSYITSGVVSGYKRLATHDERVCFQCLYLEGTVTPLDEVMPSHPNCRCTLIPIVIGAPEPEWLAGENWFVQQSAATQIDILGRGRYHAWQSGQAELGEFVQVVPNAVWGDTLRATPLRDLVAPTGS